MRYRMMNRWVFMRMFVFGCVAALLMCMCACSNQASDHTTELAKLAESAESADSTTLYHTVIEPPAAVTLWETSLDPTFAKADFVVCATVSEVGEAYLRDGVTLSPGDSEEERYQKLQAIRTPVTVTIDEVYKGDLSEGDHLQIQEFYGIYDGYYVVNRDEPLEEDGKYLLFIKQSELGNGNLLYGQCTVRLSDAVPLSGQAKDFVALGNPPLFAQYANAEEITAALRAMR